MTLRCQGRKGNCSCCWVENPTYIIFVHPSENPPLGLFGVSENWTFPDTLRVHFVLPSENPLLTKEKSRFARGK